VCVLYVTCASSTSLNRAPRGHGAREADTSARQLRSAPPTFPRSFEAFALRHRSRRPSPCPTLGPGSPTAPWKPILKAFSKSLLTPADCYGRRQQHQHAHAAETALFGTRATSLVSAMTICERKRNLLLPAASFLHATATHNHCAILQHTLHIDKAGAELSEDTHIQLPAVPFSSSSLKSQRRIKSHTRRLRPLSPTVVFRAPPSYCATKLMPLCPIRR
jgi:hypothetical protein